jgi:hypothetical protein
VTNLSDWNRIDLDDELRYQLRPAHEGTTWAMCEVCNVNGARGGGVCAGCLRKEIERRERTK